jgi:hypothetical protein
LEKNHFVYQILTGFGIPVDRIIFVDQVAKIREIIIPTQRYGFGFIHRPDEVFIEFVKSFRFKHRLPRGYEGGKKIYGHLE